ncbi:MAG TPA: hypothetical protein VL588_07855, partial [Bdellovibrionota bacterium]|nr:hypothetical protein [Bdellovibrionota bacterium]
IVAARSNGTTDRLDILGLPGETAADRTALAAATTDAARRRILQQREDATRTAVTTNGYFRVPHIPNKDSGQLLNTSSKTSDGAGASHLMFDQLQGMNMCRITTEMSHNPNFNRFKYALAGITMCDSSPGSSSPTASRLREYIPDWVPGYARDFYTANSATALAQPGGAASVTGLTATSTPDQINDAVYDTVLQHTRRNHNRLDQDKQTRAEDFARSYLTWDNPAGASHMTTAQINAAARREARTAYNATNQENGLNLSAIDDPGGVQGVPEQDPAPITALRYITEPFGINAGNWSMTLGRNTADTTYAFSDQFVDMLKEQPVVTDTYNSPEVQAYITQHGGDNCSALKALSLQAFGTSPPQPPGSSGSGAGGGYEGLCRILRGDPGASGDIDGQGTTLAQITARQLQPIAERLMQRCGSCHGPGSANGEFVGMNPPDYNRLRTFLNSSAGGGRTWLQNIQDRLGSTPSGSQMPAGGGFNIDPASTDPTEHRRREEERRHAISGYLQAVANSPAGQPFP